MNLRSTICALSAVALSACTSTVKIEELPPEGRPVQTQPSPTQGGTLPNAQSNPIARPDVVSREDAELLRGQAERERDIHLKLVQKMIDQSSFYAALAHLDAYDRKWGAQYASQRLRADALRKTRQYPQAEALYKSILGQSQNGEVWYGLGRVSIDQGKLDESVPFLEKALQQNPLYVEAYSDLGLVYILQNKQENAYKTLMKASELSQNDPRILANLGLWAVVNQDFDLAKDIANRLNWSEETRGQVLTQAEKIRERIGARKE